MKRILVNILAILAIFSSCSNSDLGDFQQNDPEPEIKIFELFNDYPALNEMWENIDGRTANDYIQATFDDYNPEMVSFFQKLAELMANSNNAMSGLFGDINEIISVLLNTDIQYHDNPDINQFFNNSGEDYITNLFATLDDLGSGSSPDMAQSILGISRILLKYVLDEKTPSEVQDLINDYMDKVERPGFKNDLIDVSKSLSRLLVRGDVPIWVDGSQAIVTDINLIDTSAHTNTGLGKITKGVHALLFGILNMSKSTGLDHDKIYSLLEDVQNTLIDGKSDVFKSLMLNMESYFTRGGDNYTALPAYSTDTPGVIFSDAELGTSLKNTLSSLKALFVREDRDGALLYDPGSKSYFLERLLKSLMSLGIDWNDTKIEESLYNMIRYDLYGRDRVTDPDSYPASHLESLLFITGITGNFGFEHQADTDEFGAGNGSNLSFQRISDAHGHGLSSEFSLNDALFSLTSRKAGLGINGFGVYMSAYDLIFGGDFAREDRNYRSFLPFNAGERSSNNFYFDYNYGVLRFLTGASIGDYGNANGGNIADNYGQYLNNYTPYSPDGIMQNDVADGVDPGKGVSMMAWTTGAVARSCFNGEGPYYYADPNAEVVNLGGKNYYKYLRPDGRVYAYVNKDNAAWEYVYPAEGSDKEDHLEHIISLSSGSYTIASDQSISISIDDVVTDATVSFLAGTYTIDEIITQIANVIGSQHVGRVGDGLVFIGEKTDPAVARIQVSNGGGGTIVEDILGEPSGTISKYLVTAIRYNRYKSRWHSDFYLMRVDSDNFYSPVDLSGNAQNAGALLYEEIIPEDEPKRACASQEEALYRNFQWVMTEKKMVLVLPLHLRGTTIDALLATREIETVLFQVIDANGWSGLTQCRIFRSNNQWAKAQTYGTSDIPGDYRMNFIVQPVQWIKWVPWLGGGDLFIVDEGVVYDDTMGRGTATPYVVGANIPALWRLAFPRSQLEVVDPSGLNYFNAQVGSRDFTADETDVNWQKRNPFMPFFASLFTVLHEGSDENNHALTKFSNGLTGLLMPYLFFNEGIQGDIARNTWMPRVTGGTEVADYVPNYSHVPMLIPDSQIVGFEDVSAVTPTAYFGGWAAVDYYQPVASPTILSLLIDSDRSDPAKRADGLLAHLLRYNPAAPADENYTESKPRILTKLIDTINDILNSENDDLSGISGYLSSSPVDFDTNSYQLWGPRRKLFYGLEQLLSSMRVTKGRALTLNESLHFPMDTLPPYWFYNSDLRTDGTDNIDFNADEAINEFVGNDDPGTDPITLGGTTVLASGPFKYPNSIAVFPEAGQLREGELLSHKGVAVFDTLDYVPADCSTQIQVYASSRTSGNSVLLTGGNGITDSITCAVNGEGKTEISFTLSSNYANDIISCYYNFDRDANWLTFSDPFDDINTTLNTFLIRGSPYNILETLLSIVDTLNERVDLDDSRLETLLYTLGKLMAYYDTGLGKWIYQGEDEFNPLLRLVKLRLPDLNSVMADPAGDNYHSLLVVLSDLMKENGLMEHLFTTVTIPNYGWENTLQDLSRFLGSSTMAADSDLWPLLSQLLTELSQIKESINDEYIADVTERYGFEYFY